ncbi:putative T7SS-secreted protein [Streptomyces angustmyceticus]|uniref:putative T7SS-secreted protein n=1 Tax=Streptomyces angustmyceticus TaxID=285578 RepID=UPI00380237A4
MGLFDFDDLDRVTQSARDTFADGVQTVAHGTAKLLDDVGAHDWADKADAAGSWAAEGLGAQTRELELNETDDPAQLLHGDASSIRKSAGNVKKLGAAFERTGSALRKMDPSDWHGKAADRFREKVQPHPKRWLTAADSFEDAAAALDHYADTVEWAGKQAREAVERWKQAQKKTAAALEQYKRKVDHYTQQANAAGNQSPQEPGPFHDPGAEGRKSAEHLLKTARSQRDSAGAQLTVKLARGLSQAPAEPQGLNRLKIEAGNMVKNQLVGAEHQLGGIIKTGTSLLRLVRTVNPQDPYNLTHPADYATNLTSVAGGLIHTANHPTELVKGVIGEGWGTDRNQAVGAFATNFIGGGGAVSKVGARAAAHGMESAAAKDAAKTVGQTAAKDAAEHSAASGASHAAGAKAFEDLGGGPGQDLSHLEPNLAVQNVDQAAAHSFDSMATDGMSSDLNKLENSFGLSSGPNPKDIDPSFFMGGPKEAPPGWGDDGFTVGDSHGGAGTEASHSLPDEVPPEAPKQPEPSGQSDFDELPVDEKHKVASEEMFDGARRFDSEAEAHEFGRSHWDGFRKELDDAQYDALREYTGEGYPYDYKALNNDLRGLTHSDDPEMAQRIARMDEALAKKPLPHDIEVLRGTGYDHWLSELNIDEPYKLVGKSVEEKGFMSTAVGKATFDHQPAMLHLRAPEGTPAAYVEDVSHFGGTENEIVLGRGRNIHFKRVFVDEKGQYHIYGEIS